MGCVTTCTIDFIPTSKETLKKTVQSGKYYDIEYPNKDYYNAEEVIEKTNAKAIVNEDGEVMFLVTDPYGMEEYITNVRLLK